MFNLTAGNSLGDRLTVSKVVRAWTRAQTVSKTRDERVAAERSSKIPVSIERSEFIRIKSSFEKAWMAGQAKGLEPKRCPALG